MPIKKDNPAMDHIVDSLKRNRSASYADIKARADKKRLTIFPIMFGRAQALLGIVKSAKRGQGRLAVANAVKAGSAFAVRRGPGRPRKNPLPTNGTIDLDSVLTAVEGTRQDLSRYRTALDRIQSVVADLRVASGW